MKYNTISDELGYYNSWLVTIINKENSSMYTVYISYLEQKWHIALPLKEAMFQGFCRFLVKTFYLKLEKYLHFLNL